MGVVKQKYISSVYLNQLYQQVVAGLCSRRVMKAAVERVKESPHHATSGETASTELLRPGTVACTKIVLPQVIARGLNITEVAHDYQATIKLGELVGVIAGTKNVAKQLRHICAGPVRTRDRTWFTELSDKVSDTYWVESFNHQLLTYLPKRIHFHTKTFEMRMSLAVMDWDGKQVTTNTQMFADQTITPTYNVLVKKTYRFVNNIWSMYVLRNITSQQILQDDEDDDEMVLPYDAAMYDGDYVDSEDDDYVCSDDDLEPWLQLALDGLV
eukprot:Em0022g930a